METYKFHHARNLIREDLTDDRINNIAKFLRDTDDPKFLNSVETLIKEEGLVRRINQLWDDAGFPPKYKTPFSDLLINSKTPLLSKVQLLFHITKRDGSQLLDASLFSKNWNGNIDEKLGSKISTNETFNQMKMRLISDNAFRGQRVGAGEFFCVLFGKNGKRLSERSHGGDIEIDGHGIEVKGGGGMMRTHESTKFRVLDDLRMELKKKLKMPPIEGKQGYFKPTSANDPHVKEIKKLKPAEQTKLLNWYLSTVYPKFASNWIKDIAKDWQQHLGTNKIFEKFGMYNLMYYKMTDKFDSILLVRDDGFCVNIADVKSANKQPVQFGATYNRGGDTNAVADGSGWIGIRK